MNYFPISRLLLGLATLFAGSGAVTGLLSGLVGSAGPIGAAVFLSLGLPPLVYVASDATASIRRTYLACLYPSCRSTRSRTGAPWGIVSGLSFIAQARMVCG